MKTKMPFKKVIRKHWMLLLMLLPAVVYVIIFSYVPMTGLVMAFKRYTYAGGIYFSPWNGLKNFRALMIEGKLGMVTRNTFLYNLAFIFLGVVFEMGSAILLNEILSKNCLLYTSTALTFDGWCGFWCAWRRTLPNGQKSLIRPGSEKDTAKSKGVHCEVVSEGR